MDSKAVKKGLATALGKARSKPIGFAFLMAKDGPLLETDPRKSPAALWATARKAGGAGKGTFGVMSFDRGKLVLRCEEEPAAPLTKGFKSFLAEHGQTIKFAFEGPANDDQPREQPAPEAPMLEPKTGTAQTAPLPRPVGENKGPEPEDPDTLHPKELEDEEPVSGLDLGELIQKARKKPMNAAWLVATKDLVLRAHPRLPIDVMRRQAKADGGGNKGALGVLTVQGKVITLTCEVLPPKSFTKIAKAWLKQQGVTMRVVIAMPDGTVMEDEAAAEADPGKPQSPQAQVVVEAKAMTEMLMRRRESLTKQEQVKFIKIMRAVAFLAKNGDVRLARDGLERMQKILDSKMTPDARIAKARADLAAVRDQLPEKLGSAFAAMLDRAAAADPDTAVKVLNVFYEKLNAAKAKLVLAPAPKEKAKPVIFEPPKQRADPIAPRVEGLDPARTKAMDDWLATYGEYDNYWQAGDDEGGEYLSAALLGRDKTLGVMSDKEKLYLSLQAAELWRKKGTSEHIQEAADGVAGDFGARRALALAFASNSGNDQRYFDVGGAYLSDPDNVAAQSDMFMRALDLDGTAVLEAFEGAEISLALRASGYISPSDREKVPEKYWSEPFDLEKRIGLVEALSNGALNEEETDKVGTTFFMAATADDFEDPAYRKAMARLLGELAHKDGPEVAAERLEKAMRVSGVREMLTAKSVTPEMRNWALVQIAKNEEITPEKLAEGWESEVIAQAMAAPIVDKYKARGTEPHILNTKQGEDGALRNSIGQAMGLPMSPLGEESDAEALARQEKGLDHDYYADNKRIDDIVAKVREETGYKPAKMTVIPIVVTSPYVGVYNMNVYRLDMDEGKDPRFVDDFAHRYNNFEHWRTDNKLTPGKMTYPAKMNGSTPIDMDLGGQMVTENTPVKVDTFWEWVGVVGDGVALLAGIGVGVALIVGSGGTATPLVVGATAGIWTTGCASKRMYDDSERGIDVSDLSNPENRANWLEAGAGVLSIAAMGAPKLLATGAKGAQMSTGAARATAALQMTANAADAAAMGDQAYMMATNWDKMSDADKAMGLLNMAFWGGMAAASTRASGASVKHGANFNKLSNQLEFGSPYTVTQHPDLQEGQIRVAYDTPEGGGPPTKVRIETGGGDIAPAILDLHSNVGRQIEVTGALTAHLKQVLRNNPDPAPGTAAWEAKLEIQKIAAEGDLLALRLQTDGATLTPDQVTSIKLRQRELKAASDSHATRLEGAEGAGWVASPETGEQQRRSDKYKWPDAPEGYSWVAGVDGKPPHLRAKDSRLPRKQYDPKSKQFLADVRSHVLLDDAVGQTRVINGKRARIGDPPQVQDGKTTNVQGEEVAIIELRTYDRREELPDGSVEYEIDGKTLRYDEDGFPLFEAYAEVYLDKLHLDTSTDGDHFRAANGQLTEALRGNPALAAELELDAATVDYLTRPRRGGRPPTQAPPGYIWHHHQDTGLMQLVSKDIHEAFRHTGGMAIWGGGRSG